jgi:hypothetical protein
MRIATVETVSTSRPHRTAAYTRRGDPTSEPPRAGGGLSPLTLVAASVASVISAVVVSHVWGPGTLYGAAATPVIVALVSEALQRPRRVLTTVREARSTGAFDPLEEGRRGVLEGDLATGGPADPTARTDHRVAGPRVPRRRSVAIALATGAIAFTIAAFVLTGSELVFGGSSVGRGSARTTLFGGSPAKHQGQTKQKDDAAKQQTEQRQTPSTSTAPSQSTTAPATTTPTTPAPTAPTTTTPSTGTTTPAPSQAPPQTTTQAPQPPVQTTPAPTTP